jgi:AcrR family transcriptional regulator
MSDEKRKYRMTKRAEAKQATRQRIVEAAMHLHEEIGPKATSISAIAEKAGVQRLTVYRHFPDETAIFQACTSHWLELNPPPDPETWAELDGAARLNAALTAFYDYFAGTERMWTTSHRDVEEVPALQEPMAEVAVFLSGVARDLAEHLTGVTPEQGTFETIDHALQFTTWRDLERLNMNTQEKVALVRGWLDLEAREDSDD